MMTRENSMKKRKSNIEKGNLLYMGSQQLENEKYGKSHVWQGKEKEIRKGKKYEKREEAEDNSK